MCVLRSKRYAACESVSSPDELALCLLVYQFLPNNISVYLPISVKLTEWSPYLNSWKVLKIRVGREGQISNTTWPASWWARLNMTKDLLVLPVLVLSREGYACTSVRETMWDEACRRTRIIVRRACKINNSGEPEITSAWNCRDRMENLRNQFSNYI